MLPLVCYLRSLLPPSPLTTTPFAPPQTSPQTHLQISNAEAEALPPPPGGRLPGSCGALVDGAFGALVSEAVECRRCGKRTHAAPPRVQHAHTANVKSLCEVAELGGGAADGLGALLRDDAGQDMKACDRDEGGCGQRQVVTRTLHAVAPAFALQLAWGSEVDASDIAAGLALLAGGLDVGDVFQRAPALEREGCAAR